MITSIVANSSRKPTDTGPQPRKRTPATSMLAALPFAALFSVAGGLAIPAPAHAGQWVKCTHEGGRCDLPAEATQIKYGRDGAFTSVRSVAAGKPKSVWCTKEVFGDPAPGKTKHCYYYQPTWEYCMHENGYCRGITPGSKVRYGVDPNDAWGRYYTRVINADGVSCRNVVFGDPALGHKKSCWVLK